MTTTQPASRDKSRRAAARRLLLALPGLVVVGVVAVGMLTSGASASPSGSAISPTNSSVTKAPVTYHLPPASGIGPGEVLFQQNCASCHGTDAYGTDRAPNLVGLGAATVDFWVSTGRMPLAISSQQALRKPPRFDRAQTLQIVAYVTSLAPGGVNGPSIPSVNTKSANLAQGNNLFVLNCAGCHTITGAGDALASGYFAPSLHKATSTQVAEAMRTGPGNMPRFSSGTLSDSQVADIVAYVTQVIQHPNNRGGIGLGGIGPVAEGFVGLLVGVGGLMLVAFFVGDRS